jgi:hypothetical protein
MRDFVDLGFRNLYGFCFGPEGSTSMDIDGLVTNLNKIHSLASPDFSPKN